MIPVAQNVFVKSELRVHITPPLPHKLPPSTLPNGPPSTCLRITYHSAWRLKFSIYIIWYSPRNKSVTLVYYVNIPSRSDSLVKSIVYKVYLRILQIPEISVNSHVAVIFLVFLIGKVENANICNVKSDWL